TGNFSVWINPDVNRAHHHSGRQLVLDSFVLLRREVGGDLKRQYAPVAVKTKDRFIGNPKPASYQLSGLIYFFSRVAERLRIGKVQRGWESYDQVVTEPVLRQRHSIPVRDLSAWRRKR